MRIQRIFLLSTFCAACAYDSPLRPVTFRARYGGFARDATGPVTFHTAQGWDVTLTAAEVAIGPIYLYNAAPSSGTTTANGRVVAQVLARFTVDALDPTPVTLGSPGQGLNEAALSAEVRLFEPDDGPIAAAGGAGNAIAHVAGTAQRGEFMVTFDGLLALPTGGSTSAYGRYLQHRVQHIPADLTSDDQGTLTLRVDPTHWFDSVQFSTPAGAVVDFSTQSGAVQLLSGLGAASGVFLFVWEPR